MQTNFFSGKNLFQNDLHRIPDLDNKYSITSADLYADGKCMNRYIVRYEGQLLKDEQQHRYPARKFVLVQQAKYTFSHPSKH